MSRSCRKKLTLLTKLSEDERSELTENTDLENTSVRELEEKVKQLKIKADKADMLSGRLEDMNNICDTISKQRDKADRRIRQLEAEIKELENRPIEVAVETDSKEVANLKDAMRRVDLDWSEKYSKLAAEAKTHSNPERTSFHSFVKSLTELRRSMRKSLRRRLMSRQRRTIKPYSRPIFQPLLTA